MKSHIAQTISDLRAEAEHLAGMISALERYGAEGASPTAPAVQAPQPPVPAPEAHPRAQGRASLPPSGKPRGPYKPRKPKTVPEVSLADLTKEPEGVTELVRAAVARLTEPFSRVDVIHWLTTHYPEKMEDIKPVAVDGVLCRFRKSGELIEAGERPGLTGPLTLHKRS